MKMYVVYTHQGDSNDYIQHTVTFIEDRTYIPKSSPFASWLGAMINPQWLELPMSRTNVFITERYWRQLYFLCIM